MGKDGITLKAEVWMENHKDDMPSIVRRQLTYALEALEDTDRLDALLDPEGSFRVIRNRKLTDTRPSHIYTRAAIDAVRDAGEGGGDG